MSTVINTNLASLFAQNSLSNAQNNLATSVQRLSSGLRINSAKDDAAGLVISQNMQGQINGVNQSIRNLSDATNLLQTADSSLSSIQDMLLRMKQLATQGFDGSLSKTQKAAIVNEMVDLNNEINNTSSRTKFNGIELLSNGSSVDKVGADIYEGQYIVKTAAQLGTAGTLTSNTGSLTVTGASAATYTLRLDNDDIVRQMASTSGDNTLTFNVIGDQATLKTTLNGVPKAQTLTINPASADSSGNTKINLQTLDFTDFGVHVDLKVTTAANTPLLGSTIAASLNNATFDIKGEASKLIGVDASGAEPTTYSFAAGDTASKLKVTWTDSSNVAHADQLDLANLTFTGGTDTTIAFKSAGITFNVHNFQTRSTASELVTEIGALAGSVSGTTGQLIVLGNGTSNLKFQSGSDSDEFISIKTSNVMTGTNGSTRGASSDMIALGQNIDSSTGLTSLSDSSSLDQWQTAFKNAAAAVDKAVDFISTQRSVYGSQMNRLSYVSSNLTAQSTNLQNSRSAIIDTDFASETAKLTKGQIMQQAATAMLAQANQMPNVILSLLK
jgi:flagellin